MTPEKSPAELFTEQVAKLSRLHFAEILGWALVVAFALFVIANVVGAVLTSNTSTNLPGFPGSVSVGEPISVVLLTATTWASRPEVSLILIAALGLAWWQVGTLRHEDEGSASDDEVQQALTHTTRARELASATGLLLCIAGMAAVGFVVGSIIETNGAGWDIRVVFLCDGAATFIICAAGVFGVYLLHARPLAGLGRNDAGHR